MRGMRDSSRVGVRRRWDPAGAVAPAGSGVRSPHLHSMPPNGPPPIPDPEGAIPTARPGSSVGPRQQSAACAPVRGERRRRPGRNLIGWLWRFLPTDPSYVRLRRSTPGPQRPNLPAGMSNADVLTANSLRVLVADQDPLVRRVVRDALGAGGICVVA